MALKLVNLSKRYKDKWVLRDVSFDVAKGEIFGVYGRSGSGKTWLLRSIHGSSAIDTGSVSFDNKDVTKSGADARRFVSPDLSNGSIWSRLFADGGTASRRERRHRAFGQAVKTADRVLLLDEPFCEMDTAERHENFQACRNAARERDLSIIFASSDFEQILEICDRVAIIVGGEIKQIGVPQDIYENPNSRAVAEITGRNNLFEARRLTSSKAEITEFHTIDGGHRLFARHMERAALGALNQNVTLGIRPEQVSISFGASFPADNLLKAEVTAVKFLGATTLVDLNADGLKLSSLVLRLVGLNPGDECMVALPPDRILTFKD